jgi:hypothetical protein
MGRDAWAWLGVVVPLLLVQLAGASHVVYENLLELKAEAEAVPPSIVDPQLRAGYHFQPPKNWINGKVNLPNLLSRTRCRRLAAVCCSDKSSLRFKIYHIECFNTN